MEKYDLVGVDGNAFSVMGYVRNALKETGLRHLMNEYSDKAMSGDYNNLLSVSIEYLDKANEKAEELGMEED